MAVFHFQEALRRGTDDLIISEIQISAKKERDCFSEDHKKTSSGCFSLSICKLLCHIGNVDITFYNIPDHPVHCLLVFLFSKFGWT